MGVNNKQRRQQKKARRDRQRRVGHDAGRAHGAGRAQHDAWTSIAHELTVAMAIREAAEAVFHGRDDATELLTLLVAGPPVASGRRMVARDLQAELESEVLTMASGHWRPGEIVRQVRRRIGAGGEVIAAAVVHGAWRRLGDRDTDPEWAAEAATIATSRWRLDHASPTWAGDVEAALEVLGLLSHLPALAECRNAGGSNRYDARSTEKGRVLEKARHLLSKAESTNFPEEAEALTAKAQDLLSRYSIDRAALGARDKARRRSAAAVRRIWIDDPYVMPKAQLLHVVATANRCRSVITESLGLATVAGHDDDLDTVETLFTSLLVQATTQITAAGSRTDGTGRSRTRAFRQSFLVAFAVRIGQRLREAEEASVSAGAAAHGGALLPVLASRSSAADEAIDEIFPELVTHHAHANDREGWVA
ncbi:MAG: DUF2786 domain-containing protein, partial [Acidimicrobiales bacterium]